MDYVDIGRTAFQTKETESATAMGGSVPRVLETGKSVSVA